MFATLRRAAYASKIKGNEESQSHMKKNSQMRRPPVTCCYAESGIESNWPSRSLWTRAKVVMNTFSQIGPIVPSIYSQSTVTIDPPMHRLTPLTTDTVLFSWSRSNPWEKVVPLSKTKNIMELWSI